MIETKKRWGGPRPGAGRPRKNPRERVSICVSMPISLQERLDAACASRGVSRSAYIVEVFDALHATKGDA